MLDYRDLKILILGMGKSGMAAAKTLAAMGAQITITDSKSIEELSETLKQLRGWPISITSQNDLDINKKNFDLIITSPGVPAGARPLVAALGQKIPVISEIEAAYLLNPGKIVAITGTNGKTTTTALVGQLLQDAKISSSVAGNIGIPFIEEVLQKPPSHYFVVEVSSYQLEWVKKFHPQVAVLTNLTPDHLDRHGNMKNYLNIKARIFRNQTEDDFTILNYDDSLIRGLQESCPGEVIFFSRRHKLEKGIYVSDGLIYHNLTGIEEELLPINQVAIPGNHNLENALAAIAVGKVLNLSNEQLVNSLKSFKGVPHRLEKFAEIGGVEYINDSKGTNPESSIKALDAFQKPIILIAGGSSKGQVDFDLFAEKIKEKVKELILVGDTAEEILAAVKKTGFQKVSTVSQFSQAVFLAAKLAEPGDLVLLSPACASFDFFKNFEERGEVFKSLVKDLI